MKAIVIAALLVAATAAHATPGFELYEEMVRATLRDPDSAQFRNLRQGPNNPSIICGEVNAKNGFGGFAGFKRFYVSDKVVTVIHGPDQLEELTTLMRASGC